MHVVPVIDIQRGKAVRAAMGERASYRPLVTPLASSCDPLAVARGFLGLFPFSTIYVADLDGIEHRGRDLDLAARLTASLPDAEFWIDAGEAASGAATGHARAPAVIGSEWLRPEAIRAPLPSSAILSLDFRGEAFLGEEVLLTDASLWPGRVIVMTLARVGSARGPDLERIADVARRAGARSVYAAGGIRDVGDLRAVRAAGASGALIATALHSGSIKAADLAEIGGL